jgi:hypothetical protein
VSIIAGLLLAGISLLFVYGRKYVAKKRCKPNPQRSAKISSTRPYGRYKELTATFEETFVRSTRCRRSMHGER